MFTKAKADWETYSVKKPRNHGLPLYTTSRSEIWGLFQLTGIYLQLCKANYCVVKLHKQTSLQRFKIFKGDSETSLYHFILIDSDHILPLKLRERDHPTAILYRHAFNSFLKKHSKYESICFLNEPKSIRQKRYTEKKKKKRMI